MLKYFTLGAKQAGGDAAPATNAALSTNGHELFKSVASSSKIDDELATMKNTVNLLRMEIQMLKAEIAELSKDRGN